MWEDDFQPPRKPSRKSIEKDGVAAASVVLTIIAYALWLVGLSFVFYGAPQQTTFLDIKYGKTGNADWDTSLFAASYASWALMFCLEGLSIFITRNKLKRPTDKTRKKLIYGGAALAAASIAALAAVSAAL
jgi:hypothetical protein